MEPSYNYIAPVYDFLSRLVFGEAQVNAQRNQLHYLKNLRSVLVVGGGTGWILEELAKETKADITYVEYAQKMLDLAAKRSVSNQVELVQADAEYWTTDLSYDAILTPFLFDNFEEQKAQAVFCNLHHALKPGGLWLQVDFKPDGAIWKKALLKTMQLFFRSIGAINTNQLVQLDLMFSKCGYLLLEEKWYYGRFISAKVFKKAKTTLGIGSEN